MANNVDVAFAKALDYVKAHVTPTDGGEVAAVVEKLRVLSTDPNFMNQFNVPHKAETPKQSGPSDKVNNNPTPQGGIQAGLGATSDNTTGDANV